MPHNCYKDIFYSVQNFACDIAQHTNYILETRSIVKTNETKKRIKHTLHCTYTYYIVETQILNRINVLEIQIHYFVQIHYIT